MTICYEQIPAHDNLILPSDTPLYRYLPAMAFMDLIETKNLRFSQISSWDDDQEGRRFNAMKLRPDHPYGDKELEHFYASCWTLQTEDKLLFQSQEDAYQRSVEELEKLGSDAMWRAYCADGGVRVKTTLGKLEKLFCTTKLSTSHLYGGRVYYDSDDSKWDMTPRHHHLSSFLQKRVCFRSEAEFRFLFCIDGKTSDTRVNVKIDDPNTFFDEILVSPTKPSNPWGAHVLFKAAKRFVGNKCRISQLYGGVGQPREE